MQRFPELLSSLRHDSIALLTKSSRAKKSYKGRPLYGKRNYISTEMSLYWQIKNFYKEAQGTKILYLRHIFSGRALMSPAVVDVFWLHHASIWQERKLGQQKTPPAHKLLHATSKLRLYHANSNPSYMHWTPNYVSVEMRVPGRCPGHAIFYSGIHAIYSTSIDATGMILEERHAFETREVDTEV